MPTRMHEEVSSGTRKKPRARAEAETLPPDLAVGALMTSEVQRCTPLSSLNDAAQLMWDHDIGVVPVVDGDTLIGVVTDRDIAMAAYTQGRRLAEIPVQTAMSRDVVVARLSEAAKDAAARMARHQVRRLPVVTDNGALAGILSLNDLALATQRQEEPDGISSADVADTLRAVCAPRSSALIADAAH